LPKQECNNKVLEEKIKVCPELDLPIMSKEYYMKTYPQSQTKYAEFNYETITIKNRILLYFGHFQK